jgi:hypothetical protein
MREDRWGTQLPSWLNRLRPSRRLSLEDRPSYPVTRLPGDEPASQLGRFWSLPVVTPFQPETREINQRIAFLLPAWRQVGTQSPSPTPGVARGYAGRPTG